MKSNRKLVWLALLLALVVEFGGFHDSHSASNAGTSVESDNLPKNPSEIITVYNASEYMDMTTIRDFEKAHNVGVKYVEFDSNEDMYDEISRTPDAYDVLVPSDYMIDRLIKEGKLAKLDKSKVPNMSNVAPEYLAPAYDPNNEYVVPYMAGTLGILYHKKAVSAPVDSWTSLFDTQYKGKILMWDSMRDCIGATLKMLGYSMNSSDDRELSEAKAYLQKQRSLVQKYGEEEIRDILIADEGILAIVYSGEAKRAVDQNPNLAYVIPKEGSNKWVDGFVILKSTKHLEASQKFINFMCRPHIAVRNMTETGYTSPVSGAWAEFGGNKIMFPTAEELLRCEAFLYNAEAAGKYNRFWSEIRR
jgi:spermidine/putrescine transport system substrate-binding protein